MNDIKQKITLKLLVFLLGGTSFVLQALISTNLSHAQEKKAQLQTQETQEKHTLGIGLGLEIPKKEPTILERARIELLSTTERNQLLLPVLLEKALEKRSILEPNIFALRIPLEKLTIEPFVRLGFASVSDKISQSSTISPILPTPNQVAGLPTTPLPTSTMTAEISASLFNIGFGGFGRYPIKKFGYSNISILGGLNFNFGSLGTDIKITETETSPRSATEVEITTKITDTKISKSSFSIGLLGGAGIEYFFTKNIAVSLDLIFSVLSLVSESPKVDTTITSSETRPGELPRGKVETIKSEGGIPSRFFIGVEDIGLRFLVFLYL
jgi:hypothetical protein